MHIKLLSPYGKHEHGAVFAVPGDYDEATAASLIASGAAEETDAPAEPVADPDAPPAA
jgi:hypothetical protein